jgi:hypothetical protein
MIKSFIFAFTYYGKKIDAEWRTWDCAGKVWGSTVTATVDIKEVFARSLWYSPGISPADSLGCRLTDPYLDWVERAGADQILFARCVACKSAFKALVLDSLTAVIEMHRKHDNETEDVIYKACVRHL